MYNAKKNIKIKLFSFAQNIHQLMEVSHLVVGKAGPNLIFEAVAAGKPFLAITHIGGQEDGNLDLVKKKKLGLVEENPIKAVKLLRKIIKNPEMLEKFQDSIREERNYNQKSGEKMLNIIDEVFMKKNRYEEEI